MSLALASTGRAKTVSDLNAHGSTLRNAARDSVDFRSNTVHPYTTLLARFDVLSTRQSDSLLIRRIDEELVGEKL